MDMVMVTFPTVSGWIAEGNTSFPVLLPFYPVLAPLSRRPAAGPGGGQCTPIPARRFLRLPLLRAVSPFLFSEWVKHVSDSSPASAGTSWDFSP